MRGILFKSERGYLKCYVWKVEGEVEDNREKLIKLPCPNYNME
jgi:hypothetical protein